MRRATSLKTMLCLGAAFAALASPARAQVSTEEATPIANTPTGAATPVSDADLSTNEDAREIVVTAMPDAVR